MNQYIETQQSWNLVAGAYEAKFMHLKDYNESYDYLIANTKVDNARVLEIGCGPGNIGAYIASRMPGIKYTGIDVATDMLTIAARYIPDGNFKEIDCRNISEINERFDVVVCGFCIPYINQAEVAQLLKDCFVLMEAGGLLYLSFIVGSYETSGWSTSSVNNLRMFVYYYEPAFINEVLSDCGFEIKKTFDIVYEGGQGKSGVQKIFVAVKP